jgi:hypothetical protein
LPPPPENTNQHYSPAQLDSDLDPDLLPPFDNDNSYFDLNLSAFDTGDTGVNLFPYGDASSTMYNWPTNTNISVLTPDPTNAQCSARPIPNRVPPLNDLPFVRRDATLTGATPMLAIRSSPLDRITVGTSRDATDTLSIPNLVPPANDTPYVYHDATLTGAMLAVRNVAPDHNATPSIPYLAVPNESHPATNEASMPTIISDAVPAPMSALLGLPVASESNPHVQTVLGPAIHVDTPTSEPAQALDSTTNDPIRHSRSGRPVKPKKKFDPSDKASSTGEKENEAPKGRKSSNKRSGGSDGDGPSSTASMAGGSGQGRGGGKGRGRGRGGGTQPRKHACGEESPVVIAAKPSG